ncbi:MULTISPECIES: general secretion pathway protein GspB [Pseudoalteromonas]|uniref:general secretion pathway protein GspB n=1 Tax=Pseudoalteromonas TaxID=53246 RepID=UPI000F76FA3D|nr:MULTISPECIES: general secretion pathway protein GspB [Pseudoalteromonas]MCG7562954.1 general secretion pathway protein GspB [Pseudoalteromonas sp. McH1-42]MEC4087868.1 general secretion pathway protein GspB [Pseudoalteromonas rubra]
MSYLINALKQSQQIDSEQDYQQSRHEQQVRFYRRLSLTLGGALISVCSLSAGYFVGEAVQNVPQSEELVSTTDKNDDGTVVAADTQANTQSSPQAQTTQTQTAVPATVPAPVTQVPVGNSVVVQPGQIIGQPVNSAVNPVMHGAQRQIHYQWMSVQVGFDSQGQPVYSQQLVPVSANGQIVQQPVGNQYAATQQAYQANSAAVFTPNQGQPIQQPLEDLSGYRVLGVPLEQARANAARQEAERQEAQALAGVPDELKKAFEQAVEDTAPKSEQIASEVLSSTKGSARATPVELLPVQLQNSLPKLRYQAHIYATDAEKRWIKLNNRELYEGDNMGALQLVEITPEQAMFDFDGIEFTLQAMQDWPAE